MYVGGAWCAAETGETFDAVNPATGEVFATIPKGGRADAQRAIAAAKAGAGGLGEAVRVRSGGGSGAHRRAGRSSVARRSRRR